MDGLHLKKFSIRLERIMEIAFILETKSKTK